MGGHYFTSSLLVQAKGMGELENFKMNTKPLMSTDFVHYSLSRTQALLQPVPISAMYLSFPLSLEAVSSLSVQELEAMPEQVLTDFPAGQPRRRALPTGQAEAHRLRLRPGSLSWRLLPARLQSRRQAAGLDASNRKRGPRSSCLEAEPLCSYPKITFIFDVRTLLLRIQSVGDILTPL